ncbi:MAG: protein translocase subunit SecF [Oscillospiraceae bacterium]|nr:protein translocase subunit SecF [Oscillospiraceae bacterium]
MTVKFDFIKNSKKFYTISIVMIAVIILCSFIIPPQLDIQFRGGSMITYSYTGDIGMNSFAETADSLLNERVTVREVTDIATQTKTFIVSLPGTESLTSDQMASFTQGLQAAFPSNNLQSLQINNVDPAIGREFFLKTMVAVAVASILLILYIAARFSKIGGMSAGVLAVLALLFAATIAYGAFVILRIPVDNNFIAVILTILGYSINDTIVIYDRIRENKRLMGGKTPFAELVNASLNQSFRRSINTSLTSIMAMIIVSIVAYFYNVTSIQSFAIPMIFGLVAGTFSSLCITGPLWVRWQEHKLRQKAA